MKDIPLGYKVPDYSKMEGPSLPSMPKEEDLPKVTRYPSMYLDEAPKAIGEIPEEGVALIRYRIRSRSVSTREHDGERKTSASAEIEIMSFRPEPAKAAKMAPMDAAKEESTDKAFEEFFGE